MDDITRRDAIGLVAAAAVVPTKTPDRDIMLRFCALAGNCELGAAQRHFGAEPLDLFRWAAVGYATLASLLTHRFADIGDPDKLEVLNKAGGMMVRHTGYDFIWHAFPGPTDTPESIHAREVKRLPFLARKLTEEITEGSRIFVVKSVTEPQAHEILRLLENFGGHPTQLWVTDGAESAGLAPGDPPFLHGQIVQFADRGDVLYTTPSGEWLTMCREAYAKAV